MPETDPARSGAGELSADDLTLLGAEPLRRSDPSDIGPYRVLARLGGGGMGRLYLGRDAGGEGAYGSRSLVAVKVIRSEYAEDERFRRRFEREIEAVQRVHGVYTAELLGSGLDHEERLWMATAYVPGLSLADAVLRGGPLPVPVVRRLAHEIAQALTAIAAVGIVHRDLKPSNVLLGADGVRVIDFGVAHTTDASSLTMTGQHLGTPAYMSPEQADGRDAGTASDVFSLGSVLAFAATGSAPFGGGSTADVVHRVIYSPPSEEVLTQVAERDPALGELVGRCLDKDPERRPGPAEVVAAVREYALAEGWPESITEVIDTRDGWSGRAVAVSPVDQLTVLRRGASERTKQQPAPKRRFPPTLGAAAAVIVVSAVAVIAFTGPGGTPAQGHRPVLSTVGPRTSTTSAPSKPSAPAASPKPRKRRTKDTGATNTVAPRRPTNPDGNGPAPRPAPPGQQPPATTAPAPPPPAPPQQAPKPTTPKPWKSCTAYSGTALTQYGDRGRRVVEVQCILHARGYHLGPHGIDGVFGPDTRTAVKSFQSNHDLQVDGQVGVNTWAALRA